MKISARHYNRLWAAIHRPLPEACNKDTDSMQSDIADEIWRRVKEALNLEDE